MSQGFRIIMEGSPEAMKAMAARKTSILTFLFKESRDTALASRGEIIGSFNQAGKPRRQTGGLSRAIRAWAERATWGAICIIGVAGTAAQARLLEFGGIVPEHMVYPVRKRFLRWTRGLTRLGEVATLDFGYTRKRAFNWRNTPADRGDVVFARKAKIPRRYQRALPYIMPVVRGRVIILRRRVAEGVGLIMREGAPGAAGA